jgi:circadian clock protein KaiC
MPTQILTKPRSFKSPKVPKPADHSLKKCPIGIAGLDEVTGGGLPQGRPTLVCGAAGCGKTLLSMEFLIHGAIDYNEPGVFMSFEEKSEELTTNVASLGFDLEALKKQKKICVEYVRVERSEIEETGEYDLEGLFVRLNYAIDTVKAKRVVLDTLESLFAGLNNAAVLRAELRRLFSWLKEKGVTAIITAERGDGTLTRHGLEEYVSDCVILLDHRVTSQVSTRRLRIVKYRGSSHGTNEYPFLIDEDGISVFPITTARLDHTVTTERVSSGVPALDGMLSGEGYHRGRSILISGMPGTGKSSFMASFANAVCERKEKCLYFAFEESESQIVHNMRSIGLNLQPYIKSGLLEIHAARPTLYGLEMHLAVMYKAIVEFKPNAVIVDPINNLINAGSVSETQSMLTRLIDNLKTKGITAVFTSLTMSLESEANMGISSMMDTWICLRDIEANRQHQRYIEVLKSRGMAHSSEIRPFNITNKGIQIYAPGS